MRDRYKVGLAVGLMCLATGWGTAVRAAAISFDDATSVKAWSFNNGPEFPGAKGRIAWDGHEGHSGPGCLALDYDFAGGGNYVETNTSLPAGQAAQGMRLVRLWLKKPSGHRITFRAVDAGGQTFQKSLEYTFGDWQRIEVDLATWESFWGGPADGRVQFPMKRFGVIINNDDQPRQGVLDIDDVEFLAEGGKGQALKSTYVAADFASATGWYLGGGAGNHRTGQTWEYTFNPGQSPLMGTDFSLVGKPTALRLILDSDAAGSEVVVTMLSHFQAFWRRAGTLAGTKDQVLHVPLDAMKGWDHQGGENDGQLRLPLRMNAIKLEQGSGPAHGTVILKRIEVDTVLPPGHDVLLVPDARIEDGEARFSVRVTNVKPTETQGRLVCDVRALGKRVRLGDGWIPASAGMTAPASAEMTLAGGGQSVTREFRCPMGDRHFLEAVFGWLAPGSAAPSSSIGVCTVPQEPPAAALDTQSPIGMGVYLYRWNGNPKAGENMERVAALAQSAGIKWSREEFQWQRLEPRRGEYDWSFYDEMVEIAHRHGISVYGLLAYWSDWTKPNTPEGIADYCRWVRQLVRRYKGKVNSWEVWNEPNIFFWSGPKEMYAELLARAYEAVKGEDPQAIVLGCATAGIDTGFIKMTMERGGKFDALAIHPYRGELRDLAFIEELKAVQTLVGGRPVWLTELGFPTPLVAGYSERVQASLAARLYLTSLASGAVRNVSWYDFRNDGVDPYEKEQNFGLLRADLRPKPAYRALATLARTLGGFKAGEAIDLGGDAYAFRFTDGRHDVVVACAPTMGRLLDFQADADVAIINGMGEPVEPVRVGNHITLTLDTGFPVYLTARAGFLFKPLPPAVHLTVDRNCVRAGDKINLTFEPKVEIADWELPFGWSAPTLMADKTYQLIVPADARPGGAELQAVIRRGAMLRIPVAVYVQPAVLEL